MLPIEERFVNSDFIIADGNYIADACILVVKDFLHSKVLKNCKTTNKNIMADIPFSKGEDIELTEVYTKCELLESERIGIKIKENNYVNYDFVKLFIKSFPLEFIYFTIQPIKNYAQESGYLIKVFGNNDKFMGCFASIITKNESEE